MLLKYCNFSRRRRPPKNHQIRWNIPDLKNLFLYTFDPDLDWSSNRKHSFSRSGQSSRKINRYRTAGIVSLLGRPRKSLKIQELFHYLAFHSEVDLRHKQSGRGHGTAFLVRTPLHGVQIDDLVQKTSDFVFSLGFARIWKMILRVWSLSWVPNATIMFI